MRSRGFVVVVLLAAAACGVCGGISTCDSLERPETHFSTGGLPAVDELRHRGWLPSFVSSSSYEIHEMHDLDTNKVWVTFRLPPSELGALELIGDDLLAPEFDIEPPSRFYFVMRRSAPWWPAALSGTIKRAELEAQGYVLRRAGEGLLAIHVAAGRAYYVAR